MRTPRAEDVIDVDLFDPATFATGIPYEAFAALRRDAPVAFHRERPRREGGREGPGFWCLTRHADVHHASVHAEDFSSWLGGFTSADISGAVLDETRLNLMGMDPPEHTAFRRAIREPFGPSAVGELTETLQGFADEIVAGLAGRVADGDDEIDFVTEVAAEFPLLVLAHILGVPRQDRGLFFDWSNAIIGNHDPDFGGSTKTFLQAKEEIFAYAAAISEDRRRRPAQDLITQIVHAEIDGEPLSAERVVVFWFLFLIAGNETTRSSLTGAMEMLSTQPVQRGLLMDDLDHNVAPFVEETLRFTNPVLHFRRTATRDLVLGGAEIRAGDKVLLWYPSANRDEAVFHEPDRFEFRRNPNQHLAFGVGTHFCLGARLGRLSIRTMLSTLLRSFPDVHMTAPPTRVHSMFLSGAKRLPVSLI